MLDFSAAINAVLLTRKPELNGQDVARNWGGNASKKSQPYPQGSGGIFSTRFRPRDGGRLAVSIRVFGFNPKPLMKKYPVDFIGTFFPAFTVGTPFKFINPDDQ